MFGRALLCCLFLASPAVAQEDDRDFLTAFLEDNLSDAGRAVTITGFSGALSSQATIQTLTIADDDGIWLTLEGVVLDWSRSSLLSGALVVSELSAESITIDRIPDTGSDDAPAPEAGGFSLPELPVSVEIGQIAADEINLGSAVLGQPVRALLTASLSLAGGEGVGALDLVRTDDQPGEIILDGSFSNETRHLELNFTASEAAGGLVATGLGIPGAPETELSLVGSGPLGDFSADLRIATDAQERVAGTINLAAVDGGGYRLRADVAGNLAPLLAPENVDFFGTDVIVALDATRGVTGALAVERFSIDTQALRVAGQARIAADGVPETLSLSGTLASPDGTPVLLPFGEVSTSVGNAQFQLSTITRGALTEWSLTARMDGLQRPDLAVANVALDGSGRLGRLATGTSLGGTVRLSADEIAPADPALASALGPAVSMGFTFHALEGSGRTSFTNLQLTAGELSATGSLAVEGLGEALRTSGRISVTAADIARFSALAGRPLAGQATFEVQGAASPLSGEIDGTATVTSRSLRLGIAQLDGLLAGTAEASLSVLRDTTGTTLRAFDLVAGPLAAAASGTLSSTGSSLAGQVGLTDLSPLGPGYGGQASLGFTFTGTVEDGRIGLEGTGSALRIGAPQLDRVLAGQTELSGTFGLVDGALQIEGLQLSNPQVTLAVAAADAAARRLDVSARLANLALFVPDLPGPLTLAGTFVDEGARYAVNLALQGPGQIDARLTGGLPRDGGAADLALSGSGRAALANLFIAPRSVDGAVRYDLALRGPLQLSSLSGRVTLANGRIADPGLGLALTNVEGIAQLSQGSARVSVTSELSTGGQLRVDGPIALTGGLDADLSLALQNLRLYDPELFDTRVSGGLSITGPLAGGATIAGRLALAETELRVPSSGFASAAALLDIRHRNEPPEVRATRIRAGLLGGDGATRGGAGGPDYRLAVTVAAPNQIFIRGRGIDAELGGEVTLGGTTRNVVPSGSFDLIRGRLDILGTRLVLDRASLALEGSFVPSILVSASTENDGIISSVVIEGPADDPEVTFSSSPDLPQEEVLSQLLFGRGLDRISAFQALQLANAVATLAGRGGEGVVSRLRRGFGLDDLDIVATDDGSAALRAGKYIAENVYTEVEVGQAGETRLNLNLDLREGVTLKGRVGADGDTGIGIFIERDY